MEFWAVTWCIIWYLLCFGFLLLYCRDFGLKSVIKNTWDNWEDDGWLLFATTILAPIAFPIAITIAMGMVLHDKMKRGHKN